MSTYAYNQLVQGILAAREAIKSDPTDNAVTRLHRHQGVDKVANAMAEILADDDPKFDPEHFLIATGTIPSATT